MPLDPDVAALIDGLARQGFQSFEKIGVEATRQAVDSFAGLQKPKRGFSHVTDVSYGPDPGQRTRIYVPPGPGPFPVVFYVHGGGFVAGGLDVVDEPVRALALDAGAVVVSVTYRRAPESRFPAAHDDVFAALRWTAKEISAHDGDPERIAVMGDSAGGNLAAAAVIRARDEGEPPVRGLVLLYPLVNPVADTGSRREFAEGYLIHLEALKWFGGQYVTGPEDVTDPRLALDRNDLSGLPPTLVVTTEFDTLRDEGEAFAEALRAAGVPVTATRVDGLTHALYWASGAVPRSAEIHEAAVSHLRTVF
ncbi:alpha/beta hydrolase [Amycolatopsis sp. K13G38]|uniref:Alpha/beta hydrolase n=1 Tax=Amycolatopsis acididurans TaxID=2724524 RepID=A0ABX1J8L4_9PSEU|nr:alpha/beta hydrolase [Amycolatopsis acididurans]NKQ54685.1 alpha/beta hydrolase [Amycolatopsis acididurans]